MQKELDDEFVHSRAFEERQGFAHQTLEALAQCVFEAFDGVSRAFEIRSLVLSSGQDVMIAFQMIGVHRALTVSRWDTDPKQLSRGLVARAQGVGHDLSGAPTRPLYSLVPAASGVPDQIHRRTNIPNHDPQLAP